MFDFGVPAADTTLAVPIKSSSVGGLHDLGSFGFANRRQLGPLRCSEFLAVQSQRKLHPTDRRAKKALHAGRDARYEVYPLCAPYALKIRRAARLDMALIQPYGCIK